MLYAINTVLLGLLSVIWSRKGWLNLGIKSVMLALSVANGLAWLIAAGYVVKG